MNKRIIYYFIFIIIFIIPITVKAQECNGSDISVSRLKTTVIAASGAYAGSLGYFYYLWYKDAPKGGFYWHNDNASWLQMDKVGHAVTVYTFSEYSYHALCWSGIENSKAALYGAMMGLTVMTTVEIFDGFHSQWGASWGDMIANTSGALIFATQQAFWKEQRIRLKFSYFPSNKYAPYNPTTLGDNHLKRIVKDYNSQTYWISTNLYSFLPQSSKIPKWLNIAIGYSGRALASRPKYDPNGIILPEYIRARQYFLSLDIDWEKIPVQSKSLKNLLKVMSFIKIPFSAVEYNKVDGLVWHWLHF